MSSGNETSGLAHNMVCVQYPGIVKNEFNMIETLGGLYSISTVFGEKNRRLELRMRPHDMFCKPAYGQRRSIIAVVLKIKVNRKSRGVRGVEVLGHVTEEYRYTGLCEFQYLPMSRDKCLWEELIPSTLDVGWLHSETSYFLPPTIFSRIDSMQHYSFSRNNQSEDQVIGRIKRKRYGCTKFLSFDNKEVPTKPNEMPVGAAVPTKIIAADHITLLNRLFSERAMYTRTAISHASQLSHLQLKVLLPCVAYYFTNGPWRALWVRFGYDPRIDQSARIFQTLDYRVRNCVGKSEVKLKRVGTLPSKVNVSQQKTSIIRTAGIWSPDKAHEEKSDDMPHVFTPDVIPPARQCYYQYCDILIPEIQALLETAPIAPECHEVHGWLPHSLADECRQIMNTYVAELLKKRGVNVTFTRPSSSRKRSESNDGSDGDSDFDPSQFS